ncbi:MAG: ankyrin repeat domain-containing protein [Burkholderiaceae bacterium]|nr:ankyrin repeat domain-containing protein [Burkholderiaceae bacterium]
MLLEKYWKIWLVVFCTAFNSAAHAAPNEAAQLLEAAAQGDAQTVVKLLALGVAVDVRDELGNTPLLLATDRDHVDVARALINAGADVNAQNRIHDSAYLLAGAQGRLAILTLTLSHGADLKSTNRYGGTALIPACERGHIEVVKVLLQAGVDPNHVNKLGWTCLLEAILLSNGGPAHQEIVALVIAGGADVNLTDGNGVSPLQHARQRGQTVIADMLVAANAVDGK